MRIPRIFQELPMIEGQPVILDEAGSHHLAQVLRMKAGDQVILFNGTGGEYFGTLTTIGKRHVEVELTYFNEVDRASSLEVHLGQVMGKGDHMDYAIQKSVELGVSSITPLFSQRCEVKLSGERLKKKLQQWQQLVVAACEQSGMNLIPKVHPPLPLSQWLNERADDQRWILHTDGDCYTPFDCARPTSLALTIGPEGGFDEAEVTTAVAAGFRCVTMGPRIWRTETAPVAILSMVQYVWGDLAVDA